MLAKLDMRKCEALEEFQSRLKNLISLVELAFVKFTLKIKKNLIYENNILN